VRTQSLLLRVSMDRAGFVVSHARQGAGGGMGDFDFEGDVLMMGGYGAPVGGGGGTDSPPRV
jgi:hypothetical protein